ncbi:MAG TPA: HEAT repeat domain-containing protein, partial [Chitinophagales bacterium]|nr:HEAT repeat domain-containing protein [Chitinophagales bacterium]
MKKLALGVILFIGASILLYSVGLLATHSTALIFVIFCWYYVIYLLGNLEFWGVAALLFDIRQSKRLFTMIGSGDIAAKLIGYMAVYPLVHITSSENLLLVAVGSILCSLIFYFRLEKAGKLNLHVKHEHTHHHEHHTQSARDMLRSFFGNRMIASVAFLSFIVLSCVTIITYAFYAEIKYVPHHGERDKQLASFVSLFYTAGKIMAIFVRLIITGRLANALGTKGTLLVSPAILFVLLVSIVTQPFYSTNTHIILYLFGFMAIITEVLKISLQDPIFLSLMQPLSSHLRLKGHTVVKGFMDPFALAFSGVLLLGVLQFTSRIDLVMLSYLLFALLAVWVVMVFVVDREYVRTLVTALHKRYSVGSEIDLNNEQTKAVLTAKIEAGERGEAIYILNLIEKQYAPQHEGLVLNALQHPSVEVRMEAIKLAERKRITAALPQIESIIADATVSAILPEAVKAKCMLVPDELENLDVFIEDKNPRVVKAAITGLMKSGGINAVVTAGQRLLILIESESADERKMAAEIIGDLEVQSFYKPLLTLLKDENEEVVKAAIIATGKVKNSRLIAPVIELFTAGKYEKLAVDA